MSNEIPEIDLSKFLDKATPQEILLAECKKLSSALHRYGLCVVRDPRVTEQDNDSFLDMLERYFEQPDEKKMVDVHPELSYQVGTTPSRIELPRDHCDRMKAFKDANKPLSLCPPEKDLKWRFFWRMGELPKVTKFPILNPDPVLPAAFPEWGEKMNKWGSLLMAAVTSVSEMLALGFNLPVDTFTSKMKCAPHLLAPTASDFRQFGQSGSILAGFHSDLNAFTIHGRSRFPGLYVWTRDGQRIPVSFPPGCLLVQAGMQIQHVTGGHVLAGFHEVVVDERTLAAIEKASAAGKSIWRISSTLFAHFESDVLLEPIGDFVNEQNAKNFQPILAGDLVARELKAIKLGTDGASDR